ALYPMIQSAADNNGLPIPWVALSGLAADPKDANTLYAVSDSFLAKPFIYTIDVSSMPAMITERLEISDDGGNLDLDLEGVAVGPDGSFWLGSEGAAPGGIENLVLKVNSVTGAVISEIELPAGLVDSRRSNGIEGIAVTGSAGAEVVYIAIQRAWPNEGDTDKLNTKIGRYDVASGEWSFVHYPLQPEGNGGWIGLSELTLLPNGNFAVIERDKGWGPSTEPNAELKAVFEVDLAAAEFRAFDDVNGLVEIDKTLLWDLLPKLEAVSVWTAEKLEGIAVAADGQAYAVTDNDGVDGATGETLFLRLGDWLDAAEAD
ncbi:MAG: esterase-like activity of phytase family protein, partial [Halieaceae bacterium]|nr:esterase-like activity of phytase family protein [Halieaceae bacterium]